MRKPHTTLPNAYILEKEQIQLVASTSVLAQELRYSYDYERANAEQKVWQRPQIQSYDQWLKSSYNELGKSYPEFAPRSLLNAGEFLLLAQESAPKDDMVMHANAIVDAWDITWDANLWIDFKDIDSTDNGEICNDWFRRIRRNLDRYQMITSAEIPQLLLQTIERKDWLPPKIYTTGFKEYSVAQQSLFNAMQERGLLEDIPLEQAESTPTETILRSFEHAADELSEIALWARESLEEIGPNARIGVVCSDLTQIQRIVKHSFESAFFDVENIDQLVSISCSVPLAKHRLGLDLMVFLRWTCDAQSADQLIQLAKSPYFSALGLHRKVQDWFDERTTINYYQNRTKSDCLGAVLRLLPKSLQSSMAFEEATDKLTQLLQQISVEDDEEDPFTHLDQRAIAQLLNLIRQLSPIGLLKPRISWREFVEVFELVLGDQVISMSNQRAPIQVTSRAASEHKHYDALWVTDISEAKWPSAPNPNPFIPLAMQKRAKIKGVTHAQKLEEAVTLTEHWQSCSPNLVFSYVNVADEGERLPSSLLDDLELEGNPVVAEPELVAHGHPWSAYEAPNSLMEYEQRDARKLRRSEVTASTSLLKEQAQCPFKAFAIRRLRLTEPANPISRFPNKRDRGSTFHWAVEEILKKFKSQQQLQEITPAEIKKIVDELWQRKPLLKRQPARYARYEKARLKKILNIWIDFEIGTRPDWKVLALEKQIQVTFGGLTFKGYIDRIDETGELKKLIIDHKTGNKNNYKVEKWDPNALIEPQIPMYAVAERDCDGLAYFAFGSSPNEKAPKVTGIRCEIEDRDSIPQGLQEGLYSNQNPDEHLNLQTLKQQWQQRLKNVVDEHLNGVATVAPVEEKVCDFCHLASLCRIGDHQPSANTE